MSQDLKKEQSFRDSLNERYRMVILDDNNLQEVRSFRLSLLNLYLFLCSIFLILAILIGSLIAFTPLKRLIPGYADVEGSIEFINLKTEVNELEEVLEAQSVYIDGMKNMVTGGEIPKEIENDLQGVDLQKAEVEADIPVKTEEPKKKRTGLKGVYIAAPLKGEISSGFMDRKDHLGVDIVAKRNSPILSVQDGIVVSADWSIETGHSITVQHAHNLISMYKHNSKLLKKTGEKVKRGESIAIIGNSGELSSGPHLHFELWFDGNPIDPVDFIDFKK